MTDWLISDLHLGHGNIIKYEHRDFCLSPDDIDAKNKNGGRWHNGDWRGEGSSDYKIPQSTIDYHDTFIITMLNAYIDKSDRLYLIGDFACGFPSGTGDRRYIRTVSDYLSRINCEYIVFIVGNHDKADAIQHCGLQEIHTRLNLPIPSLNGTNRIDRERHLVLDHFPLAEWEGMHRGWIHCHGHAHGNADPWKEKHMTGHRSLDVGFDAIYKRMGIYCPLTLDMVKYELINKPGHVIDHHVPVDYQGPRE